MNDYICELNGCALGCILWHTNSHTMKVNVVVMVWLSEQSPIKATTCHWLILHLKRAKETDRNFQLKNNLNLKSTAMSRKKKQLLMRGQRYFSKYLFIKTVSENYPLARTRTTFYRMIILPTSVIKNRMGTFFFSNHDDYTSFLQKIWLRVSAKFATILKEWKKIIRKWKKIFRMWQA